MKMWISYLRYKSRTLLVISGAVLLFLVSFFLYHLPVKAVLYPTALCILLGLLYLLWDYSHVWKKEQYFKKAMEWTAQMIEELPESDSLSEEACHRLIKKLCMENQQEKEKAEEKYQSMMDYYTVWAHQIKTPIAAMRLSLQNEDTDFSRKLQTDLDRIEGYVEMVLTFLRLDSESTDYVIRECRLDDILRPAIRKSAREFIGKKLSLNYKETDVCTVTDEKWLSFVIEQVISNAVKYTKTGGVSIFMESECCLCIKDSGIGITPEDLPRIFENGYTGCNGRLDKKASGIGLYLCRKICERLGHTIAAESVLGEGTTIRIWFGEAANVTEVLDLPGKM